MNLFSSKTKQLDCNWCNAKGKGEENLNLQHCTLVAILTRFGDGNDPEIRLTEEREERGEGASFHIQHGERRGFIGRRILCS